MIALLGRMLGRLQKIVDKTNGIEEGAREEIQEWLDHAKENTEFSSQYLRHGYYADIKKSCINGYCCAAHALGEECSHEHTFEIYSKLSLALTNHALIVYVIELVLDALTDVLSDNDFEMLAPELLSMVDLAHLSGLEMIFYARHIIRGW